MCLHEKLSGLQRKLSELRKVETQAIDDLNFSMRSKNWRLAKIAAEQLLHTDKEIEQVLRDLSEVRNSIELERLEAVL